MSDDPPILLRPDQIDLEPAGSVGEVPTQTVHEGPPTHVLWREDSAEIVYPEGHAPASLEPLPPGFWDQPMVADVETRTFRIDGTWLDRLTAQLQARIDQEAGAFRLLFITDVPGQQGTYIDKERQAVAFLSGADPTVYARITSEAAVRGISEQEMAKTIAGIAVYWRAVDNLIETQRIGAKLAIARALTADAKRSAAAIDWPRLLTLVEGAGNG